MILELAEGIKKGIKTEYKKVFNPENPKEFLMVRSDIYTQLEIQANNGTMHSFFGNLWKGAVNLVKGAVAVATGSGGSSGSTGQPVTVNMPPYVAPPPIMQPTQSSILDTKMLLPIGIGVVALLILNKKK